MGKWWLTLFFWAPKSLQMVIAAMKLKDSYSLEQSKECQTLYLGGSKITADGDCSHEIRRCLLLGRKVMSNLDSILKSRDITLPTKVHLVKAMIFPVVMYGCESWTVKKSAQLS